MSSKSRGRAPHRPVATFDKLARKTPTTIRDRVVIDPEAVVEFNAERDAWERAQLTHADDPAALAAAREVYSLARKTMEEHTVEVVFRALAEPVYKALKRAHPPTEEEIEDHRKQFGVPAEVAVETYAPALIAASCIDPVMTPGEVASLILPVPAEDEEFIEGEHGYGWSMADYAHLYQLASAANESRQRVNLDF